jgi:hypothetical protein
MYTASKVLAGFWQSIARIYTTALRAGVAVENLPPRQRREASKAWFRDSAQ